MAGNYDLGPYYQSSRRYRDTQRKALGYAPMTPEQIAGERYGEVAAYLGDESQRRQFEQSMNFQKQQLFLRNRMARRQQGAEEGGYITSGIATGANVLDKMGAFNRGGLAERAYTGLGNYLFPRAVETPAFDINLSNYSPGPFGSDYQMPTITNDLYNSEGFDTFLSNFWQY